METEKDGGQDLVRSPHRVTQASKQSKMGRYRSDESDDNRDSSRKYKKKSKKKRARSRSGSDSGSSHFSSSKGKKSKKRHGRSRSPSIDRDRGRAYRRSRSRSPSPDRYYRDSRRSRRSRSYSRSPSPRRGHRSRSRSPSNSRRRRSRSYSRERRSMSGGRNRSHSRRSTPDSRSNASTSLKSKMTLGDGSGRGTPVADLTPAQQAEERMRLALKAAAAADQKLREAASSGDAGLSSVVSGSSESSKLRFSSYEESQNFADSVASIDSDSFHQSTFKSSRSSNQKESSVLDMPPSHEDAIFGSLAVTGFTIKPDPDMKPISLDADSIIHPSLFSDPEERLDRWIERLAQLRKRKLEGDAI